MKKFLFATILFTLLGCSQDINSESFNNKPSINKNQNPLEKEQSNTDLTTKQNVTSININKNAKNPNSPTKTEKKNQIILDVPLINQNPELKYGCEVTSLAMMLQYAGVKVNKMDLYHQIKKDNDPIIKSPAGDIKKWGNPSEGFVGDMTGKSPGYAVFDKPIEKLVNKYLPGRAVNLTNKSFDEILIHVSNDFPVVIWTTGDYRLPNRWESWTHGNTNIKTPLDLHAVVLVGYNNQFVFLNDPLSGKKQVKVKKEQFIKSWQALKKRAVSYK